MSDDPHYQATEDAHTGPIKNPKQLLLAVFFSFIAPILIIVGLVSYVVSGTQPSGTAGFPLGEIRSLQIASMLGLVGAVVLAALALLLQIMDPMWVAILGFFLISQAFAGWRHAQALAQEKSANGQARLVPALPGSERPSP